MQSEIEPEGISRDAKRPFSIPGGRFGIRIPSVDIIKIILTHLFSQ